MDQRRDSDVTADCVFCQIVAGQTPAVFEARHDDAVAIRPLNPVAPGHVLVLPTTHVPDMSADPAVSAATMRVAALVAADLMPADFNLITSKGRAATQSVFHLHLHLVPRAVGDGLALPWWSGKPGRGGAQQ